MLLPLNGSLDPLRTDSIKELKSRYKDYVGKKGFMIRVRFMWNELFCKGKKPPKDSIFMVKNRTWKMLSYYVVKDSNGSVELVHNRTNKMTNL